MSSDSLIASKPKMISHVVVAEPPPPASNSAVRELAGGTGFEPVVPYSGTPAYQAGAFDRSATPISPPNVDSVAIEHKTTTEIASPSSDELRKRRCPPSSNDAATDDGGASSFIADIHAVVDGMNFGSPTAKKRGRSSDLPYVPVIDHGGRTEQIKGLAFPDHAAAIEHAAKTIAFRRAYLFERLKEPRLRALRRSHGLPADIPATPAPQPKAEGIE